MKSKFQKSEKRLLKRSAINFASYNPRKLSEKARIELKKNIKRVGLLGGVVWNETTGNLVSGHQRLTVLDSLENYPKNDYELEVDVVALDEKTEIEQNIFMNSTTAQGEFDLSALNELISDMDLEIGNLGFSEADFQIIGVESLKEKHKTPEPYKANMPADEVEELDEEPQSLTDFLTPEEKKERVKEMKREIREKLDENQTTEPYLMISFPDVETKFKYMERLNLKKDLNIIDSRTFEIITKKLYS